MRVTDHRQAKIINRLANQFADGDIERVQRAIGASSKNNQPAALEDVVRYLKQERGREQRVA
jgi:hypothetical protein